MLRGAHSQIAACDELEQLADFLLQLSFVLLQTVNLRFNVSIMASLPFSLMRSNDSSKLGDVESALGFFAWLGVAGECIACFIPDGGDGGAFERDGTSVACASRHDAKIKRSK